MAGMVVDTTTLAGLGDFVFEYDDNTADGIYTIRIKGRFHQDTGTDTGVEALLNLPEAINGETQIGDYWPMVVRNEFFWSKNEIRIPLKSLPAFPVALYAETYYMSGEYLNQEGIAAGSGFKRYSFRLNMDNKV